MKRFGVVMLVALMLVVAQAGGATAQSNDRNGDGYVCIKGTNGRGTIERDNNVATASGCPGGFFLVEEGYETRELECAGAEDCKFLKKWCIKNNRDFYELTAEDGSVTGTCAPAALPG